MDFRAFSARRFRLAGLLVVATAIIAVVLFCNLPADTLLWRELQNTGHIPLFGLLAVTLLFIRREWTLFPASGPLAGYAFAAVASLLTGIAVELIQTLTKHHEPSMTDVINDLAGTMIALGFCAALDPRLAPVWARRRPGLRSTVVILACALLLVCLLPVLELANAYRQRAAALPVIMDFTAGWATPFLQLQHASLSADVPAGAIREAASHRLARLELEPGKYPGIHIIEPYRDWTGYTALLVVVHSPQDGPLELVLRVHDRLHNLQHNDRYTRRLTLHKGENRFRLPLAEIETAPIGRRMDMSQIAGVILYAPGLERPRTLYLEALRLE